MEEMRELSPLRMHTGSIKFDRLGCSSAQFVRKNNCSFFIHTGLCNDPE